MRGNNVVENEVVIIKPPEDYADRVLKLPPTVQSEVLARGAKARELDRTQEILTIPFHGFIKRNWGIVEPANKFVDSWAIGALAEHLTACYLRQIRWLIINIFFRSAKSTVSSVLFPAWVWKENPQERFFFGSATSDLALRDAMHCKDLIMNNDYQANYGQIFQIKRGQEAKGYYENDKMGSRRSIGLDAQTTGFGGSIKVLDDPNDTKKTESKVIRDGINDWIDKTWSSRSDDFTNDVNIVIQQRTHKQDVTGHLIEKNLGYDVLKIPLEYTGQKYFTSIGWSDPREVKGESADPIRFPPEVISRLKRTFGIAYYGQAQQEPVSPEGNVIKRSWYKDCYGVPIKYENGEWVWDKKDISKIQGYVDLGGSDSKDADRTAMNIKIMYPDGKIIKLWQHSGQWEPNTRNTEILNFYLAWNQVFPQMPLYFESNNILGSTGMDDLRNLLLKHGLNARKDLATKSKTDRAVNQKDSYITNAGAGRIEFYQGNLFNGIMLVDSEEQHYGTPQIWKETFFEESCSLYYENEVIKGDHDDLLDDDVGCFNKITKHTPNMDIKFF